VISHILMVQTASVPAFTEIAGIDTIVIECLEEWKGVEIGDRERGNRRYICAWIFSWYTRFAGVTRSRWVARTVTKELNTSTLDRRWVSRWTWPKS
jgi:hypothetical protein